MPFLSLATKTLTSSHPLSLTSTQNIYIYSRDLSVKGFGVDIQEMQGVSTDFVLRLWERYNC